MHEIGDELYEESKMLAKAEAKNSALQDELGVWKSKAKKKGRWHSSKCKGVMCVSS